MTINVKPQHESLISEKLRRGEYHSPDEVVGAALSLLQEFEGNGKPVTSRLETLKRGRFTPQTKADRMARSLAALHQRVEFNLTAEEWRRIAEDPGLEDQF
jgi:Arc/MetJ-type ribon-helix-helix transcriptional regulator